LALAKVRSKPVSMKVEVKTPFVIAASCVEWFASLTQVIRAITLPFNSKLMITMINEMDPPNAAPYKIENE